MLESIMNFLREEDGLSAVEYAIAGALVVGVAAGGFSSLGTAVNTTVGELEDCVSGTC